MPGFLQTPSAVQDWPALFTYDLYQDPLVSFSVKFAIEYLLPGAKSSFPSEMATTTSRPIMVRFKWHLHCPQIHCDGIVNRLFRCQLFQPHLKIVVQSGSSSLINTLDVMCMALHNSKPSVIPLSRRHCCNCPVILTSCLRLPRLNQSSFRYDFIISDCFVLVQVQVTDDLVNSFIKAALVL